MMPLACFLAAAAAPAFAQTWDTSGNPRLNGSYYFREVVWQGQADNTNDLQIAGSVYGTINFDGQGHYTLSGAQEYDSSNFTAQPYSLSQPGTFSIAASGYGFLDSPLIGSTLNVLVSNGVLIGSSTDNNGCASSNTACNDLFIAAPVPANASFHGSYTVAGIDSPTMGVAETRAYTFPLSATGTSGTIGTVRLNGYFAVPGTATTDSIAGVTFHFSNGAAVVQFGGELNSSNVDNHFMAGTKYFYFSPDGNFFFGGSPTGWDMIVGVLQNSAPSATLNGLYYIAGFTQDNSTAGAGYANLNSGYGAFNALSNGLALVHQRVLTVSPSSGGPFDFTYSDALSTSNGTLSDSFTQYSVGAGGFAIGFANQPGLGIEVLVPGPTFTGSGVYIYPTGVVNAGSIAPFTASWAPGELVSIYGTNLANTTAADGRLPANLGGVQVLVNGAPAPIYYVSPGQINAVIPVSLTGLTASVQVVNNGTASNTVWNYVGLTAPGVFNSVTTPAVQHADYTMVTPTHPVQPGETILVYLTGLGTVDGSGNAAEKFTVSLGGAAATVAFAGTQSTVGGGYQMNLTVPASGVPAGNVYLDISGPDSYNSQAVIPMGSTGSATSQTSLLSARRRPSRAGSAAPRRRP